MSPPFSTMLNLRPGCASDSATSLSEGDNFSFLIASPLMFKRVTYRLPAVFNKLQLKDIAVHGMSLPFG